MRVIPLQIRDLKEAGLFMASLGVDPAGCKIMAPKTVFLAFKVKGISSYGANIAKQHLLSLGSDSALSRACLVKKINTDIIIFGTVSQLKKFWEKIKQQPFGLKDLAGQLAPYLGQKEQCLSFWARGRKLSLNRTGICGIINVTPDSFSGDGLISSGKVQTVDLALTRAEKMLESGADMLDIGGESTRPGSQALTERQELARVMPVLKALRRRFKKTFISVDTYRLAVARAAADEGVDIINDITALRHSPRIAELVKEYKLGCILMHMKGKPSFMQNNPGYKGDVVEEIIDFLGKRINFCLEREIPLKQLMIDPGIGFGKNVKHNCEIIKRAYEFKTFGLPLFIGLSRKSFIGEILNDRQGERLSGTIAANIVSLMGGADMLRVHDVPQVCRALKVVDTILN